ncbi:tail tape measure protein [Hafnia phage Pocis76]|uniref:Tape measure protein n=1 Tax=Hafnia phage Pocis76 TaxID=2831174 RepID=A0A8E7FMH1_9CAUD|nr:tail tape measure protein [Hafnia phage Pocis76]
MAERYAGVSLGVDVSQINNAIKSLKQFKDANAKAADSMGDFVDKEFVAKQRAKELAQELAKQRAEFKSIQASIDPTASKMDKLRQSAAKLDSLWRKGVIPDDSFFELGAILETQANKLNLARKALTEEGRAAIEEARNKEKAIAAGRQFIASLEAQAAAAGKTQSELTAMKAAQLGVSEQAAPFIAQMRQQEAQIEKLGISMGQYRQAMRMLPAQITDVTTSLASGMPIWLVAIQQGGQIKDSFGGLVPMFKALATFITPLNVGLAAIGVTMGALVYSVYSANEEFVKIRDTIKETTGLSGEFADKVALSIKELADASGKSAEDIAKAYITTKDSAHQAIEKLIDVGYSYDEAVKKVNEYKGATNFTSLNNEIADHQLKVAELSETWLDVAASKAKAFALGALAVTSGAAGTVQANKDAINQIRMLNNVKQLQTDINEAVKKGEKERATVAAAVEKEFYATNRVANAQKELNELIKQQKTLAVSNNEEAKKQVGYLVEAKKKEIEDLKKLEAKKSEPKKKGGGVARSVEEQLDKELYVLQAQLETLKEHRTVNDVISRQRQSLWSIEKQIQILQEAQSKRQLTAGEKKLLAEQQSVLELAKQKAEIGDQIVLQERSNKLYQNSIDFIRQTSAAIDEIGMKQEGMTDKQIQRQLELNRIRDEYIAKGGAADDPALQNMLEKQKQLYEQQDALQMNWLAGAKNAFNEFGESATDVYTNIGNLASSALNGLTDQMTEFLTTGKSNFKDFAQSIIGMIVKMIAKMVIFNSLSGLMGGGQSFSFANMFGKGFASGGYTGDGGKYDPAGIVHKGEFVFTKEATQRIGAKNLYRLMRGYANGGSVGGSSYSRGGSSGGAGTSFTFGDINVDVNNGSDPKGMETGVRMIVTDMLQRSCAQGGEIYNFLMEHR